MFVWRNAVILGAIFLVVGIVYAWLQGFGSPDQNVPDLAGATLLIVLGIAMAFTFVVLLRGSREM
jgi:preprotein translocase subunit SecG